jgi:butyrate kinase
MDSKNYRILVINPGSTSTKISYFNNEHAIGSINLKVPSEITSQLTVWDQYEFREKSILNFLNEQKITEIDAVVGRGGLLRPVEGGVYKVNDKMIVDARSNCQGEHVANLGCVLAHDIAQKYSVDSFTVDPVSVDEFDTIAYYSGYPEIKRRTLSHTLNIHAIAYRVSGDVNKNIKDSNFIIAHLGGGISIAAVKGGRIIDVNDANSDGPFSPERTGGLPLQQFIELCYSGKYTRNEIKKMVIGSGGLKAYLGISDASEIEEKINSGDSFAKEVYEAMAYQIAKEIGAMSTVMEGKVDRIILTGGLANSKMLMDWITARVKFIAPVEVIPGEDEMLALASGVLRILRHEEELKEY